jgi:hypothetical protein
MAKAIKTAVKAFVVTFLVVTGVAFIGGVLGISALSGLVALDIAILTATGSLLNGLFSKGINAVSENFGTKVATRTPTAPRQIIYGKARVGGTITHIETSGTDNYKLSMIVVLAGHEIESLEQVLINDTKLTTTSSGGFQYATNSKFINTDNENNFGSGRLLRYKFVDGSQTTADSTITSNTSLGSSDKFIGMAYMLIEMVFDSEAFGGGIPPLAFVIKGKKVYDPRTSTTAWSDNPALCVRDYITDTTYGLKATSDEVLDTTALGGFSAAANTCDTAAGAITTATVNGAVSNTQTVQIDYATSNTLIDIGQTVSGTGISGSPIVISRSGNLVILSSAQTIADGVTLTFNEDLYKANGITNMSADGTGVLEGLLSSCAGKISYINGKFVMFAGASVTPDMTITDDNLLAPISVATKNTGGETFNTVKAVYVDANNNYVATDSPVYTDTTLLSADTPSGESQANYRKTLEIQLPFTDTTTMAQRLQRTALLHSRQEVSLTVLCNIAFMQLQPFDWVYLTNSRLGYTNKTFEVLSTNLEVIESDDVPILATRLNLKEIDASVYSFASSSYTNPIDEGSSVSTGSFSVTAPTGLSVSATLVNTGYDLQVQWTNNTDDLIQGTEILYGTSSGTYISSAIAGKGKTKEIIPNVKPNSTYYIVARHFSANNVFSAVTSEETINTNSDAGITTPSAPTSLSATTGKPLSIGLSWTNPSNSDLRDIKIYYDTSSGFTPNDSTNLRRTIAGVPSVSQKVSFGIDDGLVAGTTYYFKVKAVSFFDKESSASNQDSGSFTKVEATDIEAIFSGYFHVEGSTTTALTDSAFNTAHGRLPIEDDILIMVNTSASPKVSKAYKYSGISGSGGSFVEITNFQTGDLVVDGTIAGAKIIAGDINADRIEAGTLTSESGVFGSISADDIDTGTLNAANVTISGGDVTINNSGIAINGSSSSINLGSGAFTVSSAGVMTATGATISGAITATSLNVTNATVTGTLDASVILLDGDPLDDLFGVSGTGSAKTLAIGPDVKNQLKVDGTSMKYIAYDQTQSNGDLALDMDEDRVLFYPTTNRISWTPTYITGGDIENNNDNAGIRTPNLTVGYSSLNQTYNLAVAGTSFFNSPLVLDTVSTPSTTTNKLYNVGGTLYFNGSVVGGGGTGDITGVTITTSGGSLTGGASYSSGDATFTLDIGSTITGAKTFDNNVVIQGNLDVQGTTTTIDTTNLDVKDKNITLNYGTGDTSANANGAGITIQDAVNSTTDATLTWNTSNDSFNFSHPVNVTGNIGVTGTVDGRDIATDGTKLDGIEAGATSTTINNNANNRIITGSGTANTLNAESTLTYDGTTLKNDRANGSGSVVGIQLTAGSSIGDNISLDFGSTTANAFSLQYDHYQDRLNLLDAGSNVFYVSGGVVNFTTAPIFGGGLTVPSLLVTGNGTIETGAAGLIKGGYYQVGSTTVIDSSRNLTNIGTISSGAITTNNSVLISYSGNDGAGRDAGLKIQNDGSDWGAYIRKASAAQYGLRIDSAGSVALAIYGSEGGSDLNFSVNGSNGAIFSGAITSTGNINTTSTSMGVTQSDGDYLAKLYQAGSDGKLELYTGQATPISRIKLDAYYDNYINPAAGGLAIGKTTVGSGLELDVAGAIGISGTTVIDSSRNLTNIGSISSGAITSTGNVTASNLISGNITVGANAINNSSSRLYLQYYTPANGVDFMNNKVFFNSSGNATFAGTISSGSITAGNSSTAATLRAHYSDGSYMTLQGYGLEMNRSSSYIRPTTDGDKILYIGAADNSLDWNSIYFRSNNGLFLNGTQFISSGRNLTNIGTISSGEHTITNGNQLKVYRSGGSAYVGLYMDTGENAILFNSWGSKYLTLTRDGDLKLTNTTFLDASRNLTNIGTISAAPIHILGATGGDKLAYASNFEADGANIQLTLERTGSGWGGIGASGGYAFMVYSSDINQRFGVTQSGDLYTNGTEFLTSARNLINIGTISASGNIDAGGRVKATNWIELESSGASLSSEEAGLRWDYNDSVLWYFYKDNANDGALHIQSTATSGEADATPRVRFHRTARETYFGGAIGVNKYSVGSGLNLDVAGAIGISGTTVIDSSRNLVNIAEATLTGDINLAYGTNLWIGNQADSGNRGRFHATGGSLYIDWGTTGNLNFRSGSTTSTVRGYITNTGDYVASGNVTAYSDKRLKTNIQTLDGKKALQMRGVSFIKDGVKGSGVIAQEIEEIAPELVMTADDEMGTKSVAYGNLVGYLIEAIKEQQQQIDELKARLDNDSSK